MKGGYGLESYQNSPFGACNFSKSKTHKMGPFLALGGALGEAIENQTGPLECWCEVLLGTTLGNTNCTLEKAWLASVLPIVV